MESHSQNHAAPVKSQVPKYKTASDRKKEIILKVFKLVVR